MDGVGVEVAVGPGEGEAEGVEVGEGVRATISVGVGVGIEVCVVVGDATGAGGEPAGGVSSDSELHPHINKAKAPTAATIPNLEGIPTAHSPLPPSARTGSRSFINIKYAKRKIICLSIENVQQVSVESVHGDLDAFAKQAGYRLRNA